MMDLSSSVRLISLMGVLILEWLGPALLALILAHRARGKRRRTLIAAAAVALLPFGVLESVLLAAAIPSYHGFCHHAPDIRYPCGYARYLVESTLPTSPFALIGYLVLGAGGLAWGAASLAAGLLVARRRLAP